MWGLQIQKIDQFFLVMGYFSKHPVIQCHPVSTGHRPCDAWGHEKESWIHERRVPPRRDHGAMGPIQNGTACCHCVPHALRSGKWRQIMIYTCIVYIYIMIYIYIIIYMFKIINDDNDVYIYIIIYIRIYRLRKNVCVRSSIHLITIWIDVR
jgi:hypothetical protein